ncbi:MAG TPA: guanylate kinase [Planctomycetaceae bacterium]|nr:guanylate kinase [Planctomycetaceae bacterium]
MWSDPVPQPGKVIVFSGPSGSGKSTVLRELLRRCQLPLQLSVSCTTRPPRRGEVDGQDYHFVTKEEFERRKAEGAFLECKEVFGRGDWYGTLRTTVQDGLDRGQWVILEIDVEGAMSVMEQRDDLLTFFIHPGSEQELRSRLEGRSTDSPDAVERRLEVARQELLALSRYKYEIINRNVDEAVDQICGILEQHAIGAEHA